MTRGSPFTRAGQERSSATLLYLLPLFIIYILLTSSESNASPANYLKQHGLPIQQSAWRQESFTKPRTRFPDDRTSLLSSGGTVVRNHSNLTRDEKKVNEEEYVNQARMDGEEEMRMNGMAEDDIDTNRYMVYPPTNPFFSYNEEGFLNILGDQVNDEADSAIFELYRKRQFTPKLATSNLSSCGPNPLDAWLSFILPRELNFPLTGPVPAESVGSTGFANLEETFMKLQKLLQRVSYFFTVLELTNPGGYNLMMHDLHNWNTCRLAENRA
ncbi:unnamed protein product [Protopolystoma xenopodis]|uniref:Uncharacterized protein n=1 Tax=Protopolystoma xenopodis TaxID=117903 RepID=A0A448XEP0_9PLAT|nr:unnamed protein product [Protopolystoma xenopodis]